MAFEININVACLCGATIPCDPRLAGRRVRCPSCGETHVVPSLAVRERETDAFQETRDPDARIQAYVGLEVARAANLRGDSLSPGRRSVPSAPPVPPPASTAAASVPPSTSDAFSSPDDSVSSSSATRVDAASIFAQCPNPLARKILHSSSRQVNKYRIVNLVAEGGMGRVSLARDDEMERTVVVKELKARYRDDYAYRKRFVVEAKITGCLDHPGVAPVYSLELDDEGTPFYAMRKVDGVTFEKAFAEYRVRRSPDQLKELLRHFVSACQTLAYAHRVGVIHRDVKPANIMIGKFGTTFVMDWGLAKKYDPTKSDDEADAPPEPIARPSSNVAGLSRLIDGASSVEGSYVELEDDALTKANERLGTPWYRDPDYIRTGVSKPCNDLYAMGVVLYVMLTGETPYKGTKMNEPTAVLMTSPTPPAAKVRSVPRPLSAVCMKALEKKPEDRYSSFERFADDVTHWLENEPVSACRYSFFDRLWRRYQ